MLDSTTRAFTSFVLQHIAVPFTQMRVPTRAALNVMSPTRRVFLESHCGLTGSCLRSVTYCARSSWRPMFGAQPLTEAVLLCPLPHRKKSCAHAKITWLRTADLCICPGPHNTLNFNMMQQLDPRAAEVRCCLLQFVICLCCIRNVQAIDRLVAIPRCPCFDSLQNVER